jgi:nucleotide-binding universal stress UspA family protein
MFKHLLVPLDGSILAEAALPAAARLAQILGAQVTLVHVIERDAPQEIHGERHLTNPDEARAYLDEIASRAFPAGIRVEKHVHTSEVSNVAQSIVEHVGELGPDLIVMCTHGRGGLRRWVFGRIAQQVVNRGTTPVLLIQPTFEEVVPPLDCRRLLVALDGNPEHEEGIEVASALAMVCNAELRLVMVVHTFGTLAGEQAASAKMLPGATHALLDMAEHDAEEYLRRYVDQLKATGLDVSALVSRGEPAAAIVAAAEKEKVDMIVLATHGKTGLEAFWSGSATPNVTSRTSIPLLLVPVKEKREEE